MHKTITEQQEDLKDAAYKPADKNGLPNPKRQRNNFEKADFIKQET